jgi:tetratricopeptide (TPR) repeat protein
VGLAAKLSVTPSRKVVLGRLTAGSVSTVAAATNGEKLTPSSVEQAAFTAGAIESALGHPDSALQHLSLMRELADRYDDAWLTASSRLQLGTLAVMQGRLEEAREQLDQALALSLAIRIIRNVTLCLAAFAQLAFAEGDPERAALLAGAAEGLQRRAGFTTWPAMRRGEAQLTAQIRQALGDDRFGQVFAAGSRLSQQEAVAAIRGRPGNHTQPS